MPRDTPPAVSVPSGDLTFTVAGADDGFRKRLEAALVRRSIPALLMEDVERGDYRGIVVGLLIDGEARPLAWETAEPGVHFWKPLDEVTVLGEIAAEVGCIIAHASGLLGRADAAEADAGAADAGANDAGANDTASSVAAELAALDDAFTLTALTWFDPSADALPALGVLAKKAGQPLTGCPVENGYVAEPTGDPDPVFESMVWAANGGLFLARSGDRRGAGFSTPREPAITHWWDEQWDRVDPSQPWEKDGDGRTVGEWLDQMLPETDTELWTTAFGLEGAKAQELRIVLRSGKSDDETFDRIVRAVGLPPLLADVASSRVELSAIDAAERYEPTTLRAALTTLVRDDLRRPVDFPAWASPLAGWERHRQRRSPLYLALNGLALLAFVVSVSVTIATGDASGWLPVKLILLAVILCDLFWPRRPLDAPEYERT